MKKLIFWIIASSVIMLAFPWLAVTFIKGDGGMAVCFILIFALNPIYVISKSQSIPIRFNWVYTMRNHLKK